MKVQAYCLVILITFFGENRLEIRTLNLRKWVLRWSIYPVDENDSTLKVKLERYNWILTKWIHLTMVYSLRHAIYSSTFPFGKDLFTFISKLSIYLYFYSFNIIHTHTTHTHTHTNTHTHTHTHTYVYIYIYIYINTKHKYKNCANRNLKMKKMHSNYTYKLKPWNTNKLFKMAMFSLE